jgi:glutathione S-transferase
VNDGNWSSIDVERFPNVMMWWEGINARPAVQEGTKISIESRINAAYRILLKEEPIFREGEAHLKELAGKAKKQHGYKYSSQTKEISNQI